MKHSIRLLSLCALAIHLSVRLALAVPVSSSVEQQAIRRVQRAATARLDRLWDDAVIPYEIDPIFSEERAFLFRSAMRHWENYTCIKFVERVPELHRNYIVFTERSCGCCSFVGKRGNGAQAISIGKHCDKFGIVVHELGHVVGFWHEHTRPDRDQHVQIISKNIMTGQEYNFNKLTKDEVNSLGLAYDYDSILHYATNTFAKEAYLDTILPLHGHLNTEEAITSSGNSSMGSHHGSTNSNSATSMINDSAATYTQLQSDFQSMLQYNGTESKVMILDGKVVVAITNQFDRSDQFGSDQKESRGTSKIDVDDGEHMLSMDNMLAKTRPEIGQRVRLSVGDIAQTNLLYKCPKCGRTIQQTSGTFYSPNYYSPMNERAKAPTSENQNQEALDFCEWRLSVGQGERIMLNLTDLDLAPPTLIQPIKHQRIGLPKSAMDSQSLHDTIAASQPVQHGDRMVLSHCHQDYLEVRDGYTYRAPLIAKLCGHISSLREILQPIVSTGNRLLVTYKISEASITKRGFNMKHETICGGYIILNHNAQVNEPLHTMYSALYPTPSSSSFSASSIDPLITDRKEAVGTTGFYSKQTTTAASITRTVSSGSLSSENEVLLNSQMSSRSQASQNQQSQSSMRIETISLDRRPGQVESENRTETRQGSNDYYNSWKTFGWAHWPAINSNVLSSPNYPEQYRSSKECIWQLDAGENHQVSLRFETFDLESHDSCAYDYVEVHDGENLHENFVGRFCGNRIPDQILSSGRSLMLKFVSDSDVNRRGFLALMQPELDECKLGSHGCAYRCSNTAIPYHCECPSGLELAQDGRNCIPTCGGTRNESSGIITSPAFPGLYPVTTKCIWNIVAPIHYRITMNFTHFDLEGIRGQECDYDYVDIRSKLEDGRYVKTGLFCGTIENFAITSESNVIRVEFDSDNSIQKTGFRAIFSIDKDECAINNAGCQHICTNDLGSYQCSCNNGFILHENKHDCIEGYCTHSISASEGVFQSTNFPNPYPSNRECAWLFSTAPGHRIKISFDQFDLESHQDCAYDNVTAYDGGTSDDPPIDATNERKGFNGTHSVVCGGRLQANLNQSGRIFSHTQFDGVVPYSRNEDCEWLIEANYNQRIRIEFIFFALEAESNCNYDQVNVYDGPEDTSTQVAHLCGTEITREMSRLTSSGDTMLIIFKTDDSINSRGFSLTYTAIETIEDETVAITLPADIKYVHAT